MKKPYKIVSGASTPNSRELADWLAKDGQLLIPLVELLEKGERAIDEVIDVMGRATIEAVLQMSAAQVAGPKEQGRRDADREVYWHGVQAGRVALKERQLQVDKPRLRKKRRRADEPGEVEIPAYTALQADQRLADRMLELVLRGVSTRKYETVLPAMADQVGVSKSEVSRETIEAGTRVLKELVERDLSELDVLVVYLDGIVFGDYHVLAAVGVDADGRKHVLGLCGGASENTEVTAGLLEDLVARGLRADRRRLFVIDGAKALRQAIGRVFGSSNLVQRCRNHKVRNVLGHLPKEQHEQARSTLRAAWKLDADEGIRKLEQYGIVAGAGVAVGGGEPARRAVGVVHGQSPWAAEAAAPLPDDDEHHRLVARWRSPAHESGESLGERGDGGAVGGGDVPRDGEALSPHHGLRASLDAEGAPRRRGRRPCRIAEGGVMCVCRCRLSTTGGTPSVDQQGDDTSKSTHVRVVLSPRHSNHTSVSSSRSAPSA